MMKKNDIFETEIEEVNALGFGVCKKDGMVVFVSGGATGDRAKVRIIKTAPTYAIAKIESLTTPSPHRVESHCSVSAACGGCAYAHISYAHESESKHASVVAALRKAGINDITVRELCSPSDTLEYRNKAQMPFKEGVSVGYYAAKTHRVVVPEEGCALLPPIFREIADEICAFATEKGLSVYDETTGKGLLRHLYLRMGRVSGEVMVCLVINGKKIPHVNELVGRLYGRWRQIRTVLTSENTEKTNVVLGKTCKVIFGDGIITDTLCSCDFEISPLSFYQINHATAEAIYTKAIELAALTKEDTLADLYCGIGTIGICAAKLSEVGKVIGVEIIPDAVKNAKRNARLNGVENAHFFCADANDERIEECNVMIVDPPRKGLSAALISRIGEIQPKRVVYVSCNPDTMARDIAALRKYGYDTKEVFPYDMFPRTAHVETVALLSRQNKVHNMKLYPFAFEMIKSGQKTIELRLYDEKRQQVKIGDKIVFTNTASKETLNTTVVKLHRFDNFEALYKALPLLQCGYTSESIDKAAPSDMEQYYSVEEQQRYGVVGIELYTHKEITD